MKDKRRFVINLIRVAAIVLGIAFVCIGILRDEHLEVLRKAVKICLECIGIG